MAFCSKCGKKLEEGEKFCGVCGTPVGEQTEASNQQVTSNTVAQPSQFSSNLSIYFSQILDVTKNMLIKPAETIERVDEKLSKEASFILGGVLAIVYGILSMWGVSALISNLSSAAASAANAINKINPMGEITGSLTSGLTSNIAGLKEYIPYSNLFLFSLVIFALFIGFLVAAIALIGKYILKSEASPLSVWKIVISASIPFIAVSLLQVLFTYFSLKLAFAISLIGIIVSAFSLYRGINQELKVDENKTLFMMPIAYLIALFLTSLIANIIIKNYLVSIISKSIF